MREHGIRARHNAAVQGDDGLKAQLPVAPNQLNRDFTPSTPNQTLTADIAYLWTDKGGL